MQVGEAQAQIREAFVGGGPGALVSAAVWLSAAWFLQSEGVATAFVALFLGGIFIFPLSALICRFGFGRSASVKGNPLGLLSLESTIAMIGCLLAAWLLLRDRPDMVFPIAAIAVGTHYFAFKTAYGDRAYWLLGAILTGIGLGGLFWLPGQNMAAVLAFAAVEAIFGAILTARALRRQEPIVA